MKRRDLLKGMAALPVGAAAMATAAQSSKPPISLAEHREEEHWPSWCTHTLGFDIAPGELSFIAGLPSNGTIALALDIALTCTLLNEADTWFITTIGHVQETAALMGIEVEEVPYAAGQNTMPFYMRLYRAHLDGQPLRITFIATPESTEVSLGQLHAGHELLRQQDPKLVIYEENWYDLSTLDDEWTDDIAASLHARQKECEELFDAAMLVTMWMSAGELIGPGEQRPTLTELRSMARKAMIADQVYFVNRPPIDDWTMTHELTSVVHMCRHDVIGTQRTRQVLTRDSATGRFRQLNEEENYMAMGLGAVT